MSILVSHTPLPHLQKGDREGSSSSRFPLCQGQHRIRRLLGQRLGGLLLRLQRKILRYMVSRQLQLHIKLGVLGNTSDFSNT